MGKSTGKTKNRFSILCLVGFILTILPLLLLPLYLMFPRNFLVGKALPVSFLVPILGFIVSIVGLITAGIKGKRGEGFGIAGVVLPSLAVTVIALILCPFFIGNARTATRLAENEMYPLGYMLEPTNTEYDVSPYRIPGEYVFNSNDLSVSETEFEGYAESKLQTIDNKTELSIRGTFQDYNFLIVRSDMREKWLEENSYSGFQYYDGYASISYGRQGREWMIIPETLAVYIDPSDKFIIITNCNDYKIIAEFFEGIGEAEPTEATTEETTETEAPKPPEFYENYDMVVFLRENINEDMSLSEIVDVFDKACKEASYKDQSDMYSLEFGTFNYCTYDHYAGEYVDQGEYYVFCMKRNFTDGEGNWYDICVSVLYDVNDTNKDSKHVEMHEYQVKDNFPNFFDYVRKSYAYDYASTEKISGIDIYMVKVV